MKNKKKESPGEEEEWKGEERIEFHISDWVSGWKMA
jgi:hypothetical protein